MFKEWFTSLPAERGAISTFISRRRERWTTQGAQGAFPYLRVHPQFRGDCSSSPSVCRTSGNPMFYRIHYSLVPGIVGCVCMGVSARDKS